MAPTRLSMRAACTHAHTACLSCRCMRAPSLLVRLCGCIRFCSHSCRASLSVVVICLSASQPSAPPSVSLCFLPLVSHLHPPVLPSSHVSICTAPFSLFFCRRRSASLRHRPPIPPSELFLLSYFSKKLVLLSFLTN